jgi:hypothetical protein
MYLLCDKVDHILVDMTVLEWADPSSLDWLWWCVELASMVSGHHSHFHVWCYMREIVYDCKVNRREVPHNWISHAARHMNGPNVLHKVEIVLNFKCRSSITVLLQICVHMTVTSAVGSWAVDKVTRRPVYFRPVRVKVHFILFLSSVSLSS